jgi:hypothetical protein
MSWQNLYAHTDLKPSYPAFISVNQEVPGKVLITVRSGPKENGACGDAGVIELDQKQAWELGRALLDLK